MAAPALFQDPNAQDAAQALASPSRAHWLGQDSLGRDLLARLAAGAQISLVVGVASAGAALAFGTILGAISAYLGGLTDQLLMRAVDLLDSLPALLVVVVMKEILEQGDPKRGLWSIIAALSFYTWMQIARIMRGEVLRLRELPFAEAARALGASPARIIFVHLIPNCFHTMIVALSLRIPLNILSESMLGFVGLGVKSPRASWGSLASEGWTALRFHPHLILYPSLALFLTIWALNILGEEIRERFDPLRKRSWQI